MEKGSIIEKKLKAHFGQDILETTYFRGEETHLVESSVIHDVCSFLKIDDQIRMNYLSDLVGVDYNDGDKRFGVVYHMYSLQYKHRVRIKVRLGEGESVESVTSLWKSADCAEREAYDMYGIIFDGHPNLTRVYLADDWEGYPLRKDYPLRGYKDEYNPFGEEKK